MNEKFFSLPKERQQAILNAGYHVFSQNTYKKAPVGEVAAAAGISKSLLFYYFRNKRDLYLFLWENCVRMTSKSMIAYDCYQQTNLFEMLKRGMQAKMSIMYEYPQIGSFAINAFYEEDPSVAPAIHESYERYKNSDAKDALARLDPAQFKEGIDLRMMYREMYLASEGYLWEMLRKSPLPIEEMERDFADMIEFWKKLYLKENG
ncbi:MAG: TetR/AcrR family transcriptional regulator [Eubacterium sp.]|nr:TetR/AcrR family transcriptional regulator [Eubacterium sp.]